MRFSHFIALFMAFATLIFYNSFAIKLNSHYKVFFYIGSLFLIVTLSFLVGVYAIRYTCIRNSVGKMSLLFLRLGYAVILPMVMALAGLFKTDKDRIRNVHIRVNNILHQAYKQKYDPGKILVLIPHCMQNKECRNKVTEDIENCMRCGGCKIGAIADIVGDLRIKAIVAKGGTAARTSVMAIRPEMIIAVACERELISGISDIGKIPVIGVINDRPNGYCNNTGVDVEEFRTQLLSVTDVER